VADLTATVALHATHTLTVTPGQGQQPAITLAASTALFITPGEVPHGWGALASADLSTTVLVQFGATSFATTTRATRASSYDVIGRPAPVVVTDVRAARAGQFSVVTLTDAAAAEVRGLFDSGDPVRFAVHPDPLMTGTWFSATAVSEAQIGKILSPVRVLTIDYVEVDPPL
jgi:hypothetical protein